MTRSLSRWQASIAGFVVLLGVAAATYGLFAVGDRQRLWSPRFTVHVGFDRVQGVGVGTPVRVRGLEAGAVAAIDLPSSGRPDKQLILRLDLDRQYAHLLFADAVAKILAEGMVGGRVIELEPGTPERGPLADSTVIASKPVQDFNDVIDQAIAMVEDVKNGKGTLGKVIKDDKVYDELAGTLSQTKSLMKKSQDAADAIQQDAETLRKLPIIRSYVENETELLVRHTGQRHRKVLPAEDLFEPSRAVITDTGKAKLDELGPWLTQLRAKDSDVVVAVYADEKAGLSPSVAQTLTLRQAEAVATYLKDQQGAHKLGWWSRRKVTPVGRGLQPPPVAETEPLPAGRIEVMVFVP
ncbi:MAG: MlaD family protein [Gemmataceae bacterium]